MFDLRFESATTGVEQATLGGTLVQTWRDLSEAVCAQAYAGPGWWAMMLPRAGTFRLDLAAPHLIRVFVQPGGSPARLDDLYRRSVLPLLLQALGHETLHASAVKGSTGVLAFCGERRAGKSTVAYALARRGLAQHADDTLVLKVERAVTTVPLPFSPRLRPPSARYFANAPGYPATSPVNGGPAHLAAIFILRPSDDAIEPEVIRLPPAHALQAVLAHAHCFDTESPAARTRLMRNYLELSTQVPVLAVTYRPGLQRLEALLDAVLASAGEPSGAQVAV
jgi:hypothetical protein